jgi:hypothetical protein
MCKTTTTTDVFDENEGLVSRTVVTEEICCDECLCSAVHTYTEDADTDRWVEEGGSPILPCLRRHVDEYPHYWQGQGWTGPYITNTGTNPPKDYKFVTYNCSHSTPTEGCTCNGHR